MLLCHTSLLKMQNKLFFIVLFLFVILFLSYILSGTDPVIKENNRKIDSLQILIDSLKKNRDSIEVIKIEYVTRIVKVNEQINSVRNDTVPRSINELEQFFSNIETSD